MVGRLLSALVGEEDGMAGKIVVENLSHVYKTRYSDETVEALKDITFETAEREFLCIIGPSGCGKSTLLHIIAGLIKPTSGEIYVDGERVTGPGADRGMVFQEFAILPWRTVWQNIAHGLQIQKVPKEQQKEIVSRLIDLIGLHGFEDKYPHQLSGGMKQRVALARTLAVNPKVVLMDEPFAALDIQTRITLREELLRISLQFSQTILFVTHSVEEAAFLGDRVLVLTRRPGRIKEIQANPLPREVRSGRSEAVLRDSAFLDFRNHLFESIREEVLAAERTER